MSSVTGAGANGAGHGHGAVSADGAAAVVDGSTSGGETEAGAASDALNLAGSASEMELLTNVYRQMKSVKDQLDASQLSVQQWQAKCHAASAEHQSLRERIEFLQNGLKAQRVALNAKVKEKDAKCKQLESELLEARGEGLGPGEIQANHRNAVVENELRGALKRAEKQVEQHGKMMDLIQSELSEEKERRQLIADELEEARSTCNELEQELSQAKSSTAMARSAAEAATSDAESVTAQLQQRLDEVEMELKRARAECEAATMSRNAALQTADDMEDRLAELEALKPPEHDDSRSPNEAESADDLKRQLQLQEASMASKEQQIVALMDEGARREVLISDLERARVVDQEKGARLQSQLEGLEQALQSQLQLQQQCRQHQQDEEALMRVGTEMVGGLSRDTSEGSILAGPDAAVAPKPLTAKTSWRQMLQDHPDMDADELSRQWKTLYAEDGATGDVTVDARDLKASLPPSEWEEKVDGLEAEVARLQRERSEGARKVADGLRERWALVTQVEKCEAQIAVLDESLATERSRHAEADGKVLEVGRVLEGMHNYQADLKKRLEEERREKAEHVRQINWMLDKMQEENARLRAQASDAQQENARLRVQVGEMQETAKSQLEREREEHNDQEIRMLQLALEAENAKLHAQGVLVDPSVKDTPVPTSMSHGAGSVPQGAPAGRRKRGSLFRRRTRVVGGGKGAGFANDEDSMDAISVDASVGTQDSVQSSAGSDLPPPDQHSMQYFAFRFENGNEYNGQSADKKCHGHGRMTYANGEVYDGEWKRGHKEGLGSMRYANGDVYKGEWHRGKKDGQGTYAFVDGRLYSGNWMNDIPHGYGVLQLSQDELFHEGQWDQGQPVRPPGEAAEPGGDARLVASVGPR